MSVKEYIKGKGGNSDHNDNDESDRRYFIKPVGVSDKPFEKPSILNSNIETLRFTIRKPAAVRVGDIIICYAVGPKKLLGYFEVVKGDKTVTYAGGRTLGALNWGADKIRLTEQFANYLIDVIKNSATGINACDLTNEDDLTKQIIKILAHRCINEEDPLITYKELGLMLNPIKHQRSLSTPLTKVSDFCKRNGIPPLTVLVIYQESHTVGPGFYAINFPGTEECDWEEVFKEQFECVKDYDGWQRVYNML